MEDSVADVSSDDALAFAQLLECLQEFEMLHIGTFGIDKLGDNVLTLTTFGRRASTGGVRTAVLYYTLVNEEIEQSRD